MLIFVVTALLIERSVSSFPAFVCVQDHSESSLSGLYAWDANSSIWNTGNQIITIYGDMLVIASTADSDTDPSHSPLNGLWWLGTQTFNNSDVDDLYEWSEHNNISDLTYCLDNTSSSTTNNHLDNDPSACTKWSRDISVTISDDPHCNVDKTQDKNTVYRHSIVENFLVLFMLVVIVVLCLYMCRCGPLQHRCTKNQYDAATLETYNLILSQTYGLDINAPRSSTDARTVGMVLLQHDFALGKVAWHGDYWKDLYFYLRVNHPFFSLLYGSEFHPYSNTERRVAMIAVQLVALSVCFVSFHFYSEPLIYRVVFTRAVVIVIVQRLFAVFANFQRPRVRLAFMSVLWLVSVVCSLVAISWVVLESDFCKIPVKFLVYAFPITFFSSLFVPWFGVNLTKALVVFNTEWHYQMAVKPTRCFKNPLCAVSWLCCCCACYYANCLHCKFKSLERYEMRYKRDAKGNVIGTRNGDYAIIWRDYREVRGLNDTEEMVQLRVHGGADLVRDNSISVAHSDLVCRRNLKQILMKVGFESDEVLRVWKGLKAPAPPGTPLVMPNSQLVI